MGLKTREIDGIFGHRTWNDVRMSVTRVTARRWPGMSHYDVDDAVADAMLDLVDYWVQLGSSVSDDHERNFAYAVTRGTWKAKESIARMSAQADRHASLEDLEAIELDNDDFLTELATEPFAETHPGRPPRYMAPSAEDTLLAHLEHEHVLNAVASLGEGEFDAWFADFWTGDTLVSIAERRGTTPDAVRKRTVRGLDRLARNAA